MTNGSEQLPDGFSAGEARRPGTGKVSVDPNNPLTGADHFKAWGFAIDQALNGMSGTVDEPRQLSLSATVRYIDRGSGDPGIHIDYTAVLT